jgi:hypothetical protein
MRELSPDDFGSEYSRHPMPGQLSLDPSGRLPGEVNAAAPYVARPHGTVQSRWAVFHKHENRRVSTYGDADSAMIMAAALNRRSYPT